MSLMKAGDNTSLNDEPKLGSTIFVYLFIWDKVFLCSSFGYPGTHYADQATLELIGICLSLPPECWA